MPIFRVALTWSEEVQRDVLFLEHYVPNMHGKPFVCTANPHNKVILPNANRSFRHVPPVHVWGCKLKLHIARLITSFQCLWRIVVMPVQFWSEPPLPQKITHFLVCLTELSHCSVTQCLYDDGIGIEYIHDYNVFRAMSGETVNIPIWSV